MNHAKFHTDDLVTVEPSYYSGGVPVFHPSAKQFDNFYQFNKAANKYGMKSGIIKVVPPRKWLDQLAGNYTEERMNGIRIRNPIVQHIHGTSAGVYSQQNVERNRSYNIYQWKKMSQSAAHQPPAASALARSKRGAEDDGATAVKKESEDGRGLRTRHRNTNGAYNSHLPVDGKDFNIDTSEFTTDRCEALEKVYWKSLTYTEPMYGADVLGSIFDDNITSWNVNHLPNVLDLMEQKVPGVNDAYLYAGLWKATFAWHLEDQDLYSINYIHFGAPKQWYLIPQSEETRFFELMKQIYDDEWRTCPEFLRHKTFLVSPQFLDKHGIRYNKVVHYEGEFIITYPYGYHAGFNYGYNLAESVNFALDDWFIIGEVAHVCQCITDAVHINVKELRCKFFGTPYIPSDDCLSDEESEADALPDKPSRKRARPVQKLTLGKKKKQAGPKLTLTTTQCGLCPLQLHYLLRRLPWFKLVKVPEINHYVHEICHLIQNQPLLRSSFKCNQCGLKSEEGGVLHCQHSGCRKSYHVTCGLQQGNSFEWDEESQQLSTFCFQHRRQIHHVKYETLLRIDSLSIVQYEVSGSKDINCGLVVFNDQQNFQFQVLNYPQMDTIGSVPYRDVIVDHNWNYFWVKQRKLTLSLKMN